MILKDRAYSTLRYREDATCYAWEGSWRSQFLHTPTGHKPESNGNFEKNANSLCDYTEAACTPDCDMDSMQSNAHSLRFCRKEGGRWAPAPRGPAPPAATGSAAPPPAPHRPPPVSTPRRSPTCTSSRARHSATIDCTWAAATIACLPCKGAPLRKGSVQSLLEKYVIRKRNLSLGGGIAGARSCPSR